LSYAPEDLTEYNNLSIPIDISGQKLILKDPGQVYIGKAIIVGRFWVEFGMFWG